MEIVLCEIVLRKQNIRTITNQFLKSLKLQQKKKGGHEVEIKYYCEQTSVYLHRPKE